MSLASSSASRRAPRLVPTREIALLAFVVAAVAIGVWLRFTWLSDMEYKGDERYLFDRSQHVGTSERWPALGMPSSAGLDNPGLSVWIFVALAKVFALHDPVALDRAVVFCNVGAFVLLFAFVVRGVPAEEREPWLWGLALAAVNPIAVLLERKIWQQSVLPIFCVAFLVGWLRRERWWGAALWGLVGALLGQIHMGGFFFSAAFVVWALAGRARRHKTRWLPWIAASVVGALPLVPWIRYVLGARHGGAGFDGHEVFAFRFYRMWVSDTLGLGLDYSLGRQYLDFLRYPLIGDGDLYPALYLQGLCFSIGAYVALCAVCAAWRDVRRLRGGTLRAAFTRSSETAFTCSAVFVGYGVLMTALGLRVWRHYLIITFPLEWVMLAALALACAPYARRCLGVVWVAQLALSLTFLGYVHEHHGATQGDYGRAFHWQ